MEENRVSSFMLERYRLGELDDQDKKTVQDSLAADTALNSRLEKLDESDRELRLRYPFDALHIPQGRPAGIIRRGIFSGRKGGGFPLRYAALIALGILFPLVYFLGNRERTAGEEILPAARAEEFSPMAVDRSKGAAQELSKLSVYLKGNSASPLADQTPLGEGNTVQLAYTAPAGNGTRYGVIFSIDGRSEVTMHYPYREGQATLLVSGRQTFLNEAYILDDAPDYEIFVMVVSPDALDARQVLNKARIMAGNLNTNTITIEEKSKMFFENCEVETVTVIKK